MHLSRSLLPVYVPPVLIILLSVGLALSPSPSQQPAEPAYKYLLDLSTCHSIQLITIGSPSRFTYYQYALIQG